MDLIVLLAEVICSKVLCHVISEAFQQEIDSYCLVMMLKTSFFGILNAFISTVLRDLYE